MRQAKQAQVPIGHIDRIIAFRADVDIGSKIKVLVCTHGMIKGKTGFGQRLVIGCRDVLNRHITRQYRAQFGDARPVT